MKILITGAAGFLGSAFSHWLLENTEHEVIGVDNMSGGYTDNLPQHKRFKFAFLDVRNGEETDLLFSRHKPNVVYHLAAYASEGRANHIRNFIHSNNTVGTLNVINACVNHDCKLIFTSSVAVYSGKPPFHEDIMPNPIDEYGLSKWCSEKSIEIAGEEQGLEWCIIRPRNVFGIRQNIFDPSRNLLGIFCYNAINDLPLCIFGNGSHTRSFTYIDDILEPMYNARKYEKQIFNLGSRYVYSIKQAQQIFSWVSEFESVIHLRERPEVADAYCLTDKSEQLLGFKEKTSFYEGVDKMWKWAVGLPMKERVTPPKLEVTKNAHSSLR